MSQKKKRSNNFSDAFSEVLKEANNSGAYSNSGPGSIRTNPLSYGNIRKGQNPPYSTYTDAEGRHNSGTGVVTQGKDETDAPKIAHYPLQTVTDYLISSYESLVNVKAHIASSYNNPALTPGQQKELEGIESKLDKMLNNVQNLGDEILRIKLQQ
ncbi:MAG: hypothetical protein JSW62_03095 [Thermoplasmatales archaeon]|nr:MAG: hypothetical protein JSW62_03095 [Thermoplasmatales archaeon]